MVITYCNRDVDVLGEENPLRFDDEEVDQLLHVVKESLEGGLGDGHVLPWADLGCEALALAHSSLSDNFCRGGHTQGHVDNLEDVAEDVQVPRSKDEEDGCCEGDGSSAGVPPAEQTVEQAVVCVGVSIACRL